MAFASGKNLWSHKQWLLCRLAELAAFLSGAHWGTTLCTVRTVVTCVCCGVQPCSITETESHERVGTWHAWIWTGHFSSSKKREPSPSAWVVSPSNASWLWCNSLPLEHSVHFRRCYILTSIQNHHAYQCLTVSSSVSFELHKAYNLATSSTKPTGTMSSLKETTFQVGL